MENICLNQKCLDYIQEIETHQNIDHIIISQQQFIKQVSEMRRQKQIKILNSDQFELIKPIIKAEKKLMKLQASIDQTKREFETFCEQFRVFNQITQVSDIQMYDLKEIHLLKNYFNVKIPINLEKMELAQIKDFDFSMDKNQFFKLGFSMSNCYEILQQRFQQLEKAFQFMDINKETTPEGINSANKQESILNKKKEKFNVKEKMGLDSLIQKSLQATKTVYNPINQIGESTMNSFVNPNTNVNNEDFIKQLNEYQMKQQMKQSHNSLLNIPIAMKDPMNIQKQQLLQIIMDEQNLQIQQQQQLQLQNLFQQQKIDEYRSAKQINLDERNQIIQEYMETAKLTQISQQYNVNPVTIQTWVQKMNEHYVQSQEISDLRSSTTNNQVSIMEVQESANSLESSSLISDSEDENPKKEKINLQIIPPQNKMLLELPKPNPDVQQQNFSPDQEEYETTDKIEKHRQVIGSDDDDD